MLLFRTENYGDFPRFPRACSHLLIEYACLDSFSVIPIAYFSRIQYFESPLLRLYLHVLFPFARCLVLQTKRKSACCCFGCVVFRGVQLRNLFILVINVSIVVFFAFLLIPISAIALCSHCRCHNSFGVCHAQHSTSSDCTSLKRPLI